MKAAPFSQQENKRREQTPRLLEAEACTYHEVAVVQAAEAKAQPPNTVLLNIAIQGERSCHLPFAQLPMDCCTGLLTTNG